MAPLVLGAVDEIDDLAYRRLLETCTDQAGDREIPFDVALEDRVQDGVGRQAVVVSLVRSQLCRRGLGDDRPGHKVVTSDGVAVLAQLVRCV